MTLSAPEIAQALHDVLRADRGRIVAAVAARTRNLSLAEDALQEASASALVHWARGVPDHPQGWLIRVAFRKAIDALRAAGRGSAAQAALALLARDEAEEDADMIPDERLRLIFTCCHPALEPKSRVALTLRVIAGLSTAEIARAFLDNEAAMAARLTRAKAKIAGAGIAFAVPDPQDWPARLQSVLAVVYLIFNAGYSAGPSEPRDLAAEAIFLADLLNRLRPNEAEIEGCLALLLMTHARRAARARGGVSVPLAAQDRALWDAAAIARGQGLLEAAMARRAPGPYQIKAAIAACHLAEPGPDWPQIARLYRGLMVHEPTPVVALNHAVARAETGDLPQALAMLDDLAEALDDYQPFHAARAEYLSRAGRNGESRVAFDRAITLAGSSEDAAYLVSRRNLLPR